MSAVPFSIFYAGDAYSTAGKIMGRQSAGKNFMRGVARTWPQGQVHGTGPLRSQAHAMLAQLQGDGFQGSLTWSGLDDWSTHASTGCLYFPSPPSKDLAHARNLRDPAGYSIVGVTFTLSSAGATDQVGDLILPPFQPWDAMICISQAALEFTNGLHSELRDWLSAQTGATRFNAPQLPVIPLGVDCPAFAPSPGGRSPARAAMGLAADEVAFLFAGRLSFHAKGHPAPMYQALERAAQQAKVVCIEAGVFPNARVQAAYEAAQRALAPSVRFIWVDGKDEARYQQAWQGSDVFVSLSDNIQETFGLTPVEAMAAGLPVVVSDWNGYKETVRDGIDGYRVPTVLPPAGCGADLALRHALELDSYDFYVGRASLATVIDPELLAQAMIRLATQPQLRASMGQAGLRHAQAMFDWPVILRQYAQLAGSLAELRRAAGPQPAQPWPGRADPFARFAQFPSATLGGTWLVSAQPDAQPRLRDLLQLSVANYAFDTAVLPAERLADLLAPLLQQGPQSVNSLLAAVGMADPVGVRLLMWLWKFDVIRARPV